MNKSTRTYVHISRGEGDEQKDSALPEARVKAMVEEKEVFKQHSTLSYVETEFASMEEFFDFQASDQVKLDIINRGWTLAQQQTARQLVIEDHADYVNTEEPIDITAEAIQPKERRKAQPGTKARKSMSQLIAEDPAEALRLIAEFQAELAAAAAAAQAAQ